MNNDLTLLYVEDDSEILENVSFLLSRYVKKVYNANDGEEALSVYKEHKPDILVSDINIPKLSGLDLASIIRKENENIPIVLITAHNDEILIKKAAKINVSSYVVKPFSLQDLTKAIEKAIEEV